MIEPSESCEDGLSPPVPGSRWGFDTVAPMAILTILSTFPSKSNYSQSAIFENGEREIMRLLFYDHETKLTDFARKDSTVIITVDISGADVATNVLLCCASEFSAEAGVEQLKWRSDYLRGVQKEPDDCEVRNK
jgi:hypothetical protein